MDKYKTYQCADFVSDQLFIDWVHNPVPESDAFWMTFTASNPGLKHEIDDARLIIQSMKFEESELTDTQIKNLWCRIGADSRRKSHSIKRYLIASAVCAASVALLFGVWQWMSKRGLSDETVDPLIQFAATVIPVEITRTEIQVVLADQTHYMVATENADLHYDEKGQLVVNTQEVIRQGINPEKTDEVSFNQVIVPWGKRTTVTFADGSKLWLNAGSRAVYPVEFTGKKREVFIEGEAYFEIARNEAKPFIVKTSSNVEVTVLGTSFNVNAYPREDKTEIALVNGSVQVINKNRQVTQLQSDQVISIHNHTAVQEVKTIDIYDYICWKDGLLQFKSENLEIILRKLERHYAIPVVIETSLKEDIISGKLDMKEDIVDVLEVILILAPIQYKLENNQIFIYKK
ncbi:MAG: FecR family protein [Bacteroidales bacterium]|jgi:hypothetical protein|nr:FecR family protein [Bacteroidales bacterium]